MGGLISKETYNRYTKLRSEMCSQKTPLTLVFSLSTQNLLVVQDKFSFYLASSIKHYDKSVNLKQQGRWWLISGGGGGGGL